MSEVRVREVFGEAGAVITDSHIVYTSGKHGSTYVNKDMIYRRPRHVSELCRGIAEHFSRRNQYAAMISVVAAPAVGGVALVQWTTHWLTEFKKHDVVAVYAERSTDDDTFVFNRGYAQDIPGKRVLVVEDVLTTGGSARKVIEAVREAGGEVVGLGALCNRGGVTVADAGNPPELFALLNVTMDAWDEAECPLCARGVPINTEVGKGKEYLAKKAAR